MLSPDRRTMMHSSATITMTLVYNSVRMRTSVLRLRDELTGVAIYLGTCVACTLLVAHV